jgi:FAD/FMN-containing dehydrogenase
VVADITGLDRILATEVTDGYVTVESGVSVRRLDQHLRAHGCHLAMHPDAYGDTPVGASFANGTTAGIGMLWGTFADQVLGLEVTLGDGTAVQIGASRMLRAGPGAIAQGLPDLRSLFFGAEGALGVVTEMDIALVPAPEEARVSWSVDQDRFDDVLAAGLYWRRRGCVETLRWTWTGAGQLTVGVSSRVSEGELRERVLAVRQTLPSWPTPHVEIATEVERKGQQPDYDRKWPGPPGSTWKSTGAPFAGIDAFVPFGRAANAYAWARRLTLSVPHRARIAAYFGRDGVNIGVHCMFGDASTRARGRAELEECLGELASFDAVPYRPGIVWMRQLQDRWDGRTLDPDGRIPGAGVLGVRSAAKEGQ